MIFFFFLGGGGGYLREHPKAQRVLKRFRRQGHGFKSHPKHTGRVGNRTQGTWAQGE